VHHEKNAKKDNESQTQIYAVTTAKIVFHVVFGENRVVARGFPEVLGYGAMVLAAEGVVRGKRRVV